MKERLKNYIRESQKPLKYAEYGSSELDYRANVYNKDAEIFYKNCGVKISEYAFFTSSFFISGRFSNITVFVQP